VAEPSLCRRRLIGAYFTMEYALESVALFNPSIVPAIDQEGVPPRCVRFLMSLRAVGEGHVSSVVFRRGLIGPAGEVEIEPTAPISRILKAIEPSTLLKVELRRDLNALGTEHGPVEEVFARLGEQFTMEELSHAIAAVRAERAPTGVFEQTCE